MFEIVFASIAIASVGAWCYTLCEKWGIFMWWQMNTHFSLIEEMLSCQFCRTWWICVVLSLLTAWCIGDVWLLICPFISTKIAQKLI